MPILVMMSQMILYICFALLFGYFIIQLINPLQRPSIRVPAWLMKLCTVGIMICSFIPVWHIVLYLIPANGLGQAMMKVLFTFDIGVTWLWTFGLGLVLLTTLYLLKGKFLFISGLLLSFAMTVSVAWSSHASAMQAGGVISDAIHLIAVSIWVGLVLIVGWFATSTAHWAAFLKWFTPVAFFCLMCTLLSGFLLMDVMVPDYTDSWISSYGMGLLLKHLFILPLLVYALANGLIIKWMLYKQADFNPIPWVRLEGIILLVLFIVTAVFTQQSPPTVNLMQSQISPLFTWLTGENYVAGMTLQFDWQLTTFLLIGCALLLVVLLIVSFIKQAPRILALLFSVLIVFCVYVALMTSVILV